MLLYDERGSQLFDQICELEEYYVPAAELEILRTNGDRLARQIGSGALVIELGSGSNLKIRVLLDQLPAVAGYVPVDISRKHLLANAESTARSYPSIAVHPVCADFTTEFELPAVASTTSKRVVYFPGSTIGNFSDAEAVKLLEHVARLCTPGGVLLIGVDLQKSRAVLEAAYDDPAGISAAFALNVLDRLNRDFGADFETEAFEYRAVYDETFGRVEMSLVSLADQSVRLGDAEISLRRGEQIRTEYSRKYTVAQFGEVAAQAGFDVESVWLDSESRFSLQYLVAR